MLTSYTTIEYLAQKTLKELRNMRQGIVQMMAIAEKHGNNARKTRYEIYLREIEREIVMQDPIPF